MELRLSDAQWSALVLFDALGDQWCRPTGVRTNTVWSLHWLGLVEARTVWPSGGTSARITAAGRAALGSL